MFHKLPKGGITLPEGQGLSEPARKAEDISPILNRTPGIRPALRIYPALGCETITVIQNGLPVKGPEFSPSQVFLPF
jgi:hypothetical protein